MYKRVMSRTGGQFYNIVLEYALVNRSQTSLPRGVALLSVLQCVAVCCRVLQCAAVSL